MIPAAVRCPGGRPQGIATPDDADTHPRKDEAQLAGTAEPILRLSGVTKRFDGFTAVDASTSTSRGRVLHHRRPVRLRQDHAAAHAGRHGDARAPATSCLRGKRHQRPAGQPPADLPRVPVAGAVPAQDVGENIEFPLKMRGVEPAAREERALELMRHAAPAGELLRQERDHVLGRRAAARRARPRLRLRPRDPVLRRAAVGDRLQAQARRSRKSSRTSTGNRQDLHLHHPQPRGGDGDERPDRRDARPAGSSRSARPTTIYIAPARSVRLRVHGRRERHPGRADGAGALDRASRRPDRSRCAERRTGSPAISSSGRNSCASSQRPGEAENVVEGTALQRIFARLAHAVPGARRRQGVRSSRSSRAAGCRQASSTTGPRRLGRRRCASSCES